MPETMKLLGNIGIKKTRDKHHENVPHLEITEVILVHLTFLSNHYQKNFRFFYALI